MNSDRRSSQLIVVLRQLRINHLIRCHPVADRPWLGVAVLCLVEQSLLVVALGQQGINHIIGGDAIVDMSRMGAVIIGRIALT